MVVAMAQADDVQQFHAPRNAVIGRQPGKDGRQGDVLQRRHDRDEIERLEDVADGVAAQIRQFPGI